MFVYNYCLDTLEKREEENFFKIDSKKQIESIFTRVV